MSTTLRQIFTYPPPSSKSFSHSPPPLHHCIARLNFLCLDLLLLFTLRLLYPDSISNLISHMIPFLIFSTLFVPVLFFGSSCMALAWQRHWQSRSISACFCISLRLCWFCFLVHLLSLSSHRRLGFGLGVLGLGLDALGCDVFSLLLCALVSWISSTHVLDLGLVMGDLQWIGCKATLVSLGFLLVYYWMPGQDYVRQKHYHWLVYVSAGRPYN